MCHLFFFDPRDGGSSEIDRTVSRAGTVSVARGFRPKYMSLTSSGPTSWLSEDYGAPSLICFSFGKERDFFQRTCRALQRGGI